MTALLYAIYSRKTSVVKYLIEDAGAEFSSPTARRELSLAASVSNAEIAQILLAQETVRLKDIPFEDDNTLHLPTKFGQNETIDVLLSHGAGLETPNSFGSTPLLLAFQYSNLPVIETLLKRGANIRATGSEGRTAIFYAIASLQPLNVFYLLQTSLDI